MEYACGLCEPLARLAGSGGAAVPAPAALSAAVIVWHPVQGSGQCGGFARGGAAKDPLPGQSAAPGTAGGKCHNGGPGPRVERSAVAGQPNLEEKVPHPAGLCASVGYEAYPDQGGRLHHPTQPVLWPAAVLSGIGADAGVYTVVVGGRLGRISAGS